MANFCHACTIEIFGEEHADDNDFAGIVHRGEKYYGLCEGCGWITMDNTGRKIKEEDDN